MELHLFKLEVELLEDLVEEFFDPEEPVPVSDDEAVLARLWERGEREGVSRRRLRELGFGGICGGIPLSWGGIGWCGGAGCSGFLGMNA